MNILKMKLIQFRRKHIYSFKFVNFMNYNITGLYFARVDDEYEMICVLFLLTKTYGN